MDNTKGTLIGIGLGGTNARVGAVAPGGELLHWKDTPLEAALGPEAG